MKARDRAQDKKNQPLPKPAAAETAGPITWPWPRPDWRSLLIVVAVAVVVRLAYFLTVQGETWFIRPVVDAGNYDAWAREILAGDFLGKEVFVHSPLYAYWLALLYWITGSQTVIVSALQLLLGAASCGLVWYLGRQLFGRVAAVVAGLAEAAYGIAVFHEGTLLTVLLIHLLNLAVLASSYWAFKREDPKAWMLPGAFLGLSILARPNILLLFFVLASWVWLFFRKQGWARVLARLFFLGFSMSLMVLPATARNFAVLGEFMLTVPHGGVNFYLGNALASTGYHLPFGRLGLKAGEVADAFRAEAEKRTRGTMTYSQSSRFWFQQAWREIGEDPSHWLGLLGRKTLLFLNHYEYTTSLNFYAVRERSAFFQLPWIGFGLVGPLGLLGMILMRQRWRELLPFYGLAVVVLASNVLLMVSSEYRYAAMPAFFLFGGAAVAEVLQRLREGQRHGLAFTVAGLLILGVVVNLDVLGKESRDYHLGIAHNTFGGMYGKLGFYEKAAEEYGRAQRYFSGKTGEWTHMALMEGRALLDAGKPEAALAAFREAYALAPDRETGHELARVLVQTGYVPDAVELLAMLLRAEPANPMAHWALGNAYLWRRQDHQAQKAFEQAMVLDPAIAPAMEASRLEILASRAARPAKTGSSDPRPAGLGTRLRLPQNP